MGDLADEIIELYKEVKEKIGPQKIVITNKVSGIYRVTLPDGEEYILSDKRSFEEAISQIKQKKPDEKIHYLPITGIEIVEDDELAMEILRKAILAS